MVDSTLPLEDRATLHRALGDLRRLTIVDALHHSDRSVSDLALITGLSTNLLAFHLKVLEDAGVIARTVSQGDARRRYVTLDPRLQRYLDPAPTLGYSVERVLFVCTANSARSQLAAHLWRARTGAPALSAGTAPAERVHPNAVDVARRHGLDLTDACPTAYHDLDVHPDLVVSVCDRAHESVFDLDAPRLHWSVADPVGQGADAFEEAFGSLVGRIDRLASATRAA